MADSELSQWLCHADRTINIVVDIIIIVIIISAESRCIWPQWFCLNGMALNPDKSDAIPLCTHQRSSGYTSLGCVDVAVCSVPLSHHIKVLGVTLDSHLSFDKHISLMS